MLATPKIGVLLLLLIPATVRAQTDLNVTTKNDTGLERRAKEQLERLVREYDIARWIFTTDVIIESRVIPHSHPVLTLNTHYVDDDVQQLSAFLHEEFHWWETQRSDATEATIADFRVMYPEVPVGDEGGARDEYSTYLHLIVCDLEFQAMTLLVGEAKARALMASQDHYQWVYEHVLRDARVRAVNVKHGWVAG